MKNRLHVQYCNNHSLLVVNQQGKIKVLYTPFPVVCIYQTQSITVGVRVYVEEVLSNDKDELQYVIFDSICSYKHFKIPVLF